MQFQKEMEVCVWPMQKQDAKSKGEERPEDDCEKRTVTSIPGKYAKKKERCTCKTFARLPVRDLGYMTNNCNSSASLCKNSSKRKECLERWSQSLNVSIQGLATKAYSNGWVM